MIGYKAHIAADAGTQLVRAARLTPANLHDSTQAAGLVTGDETYVMADKAYDTRAFRTHLKEQGIIDHVLNAARHNKTLTRKQELANSWISPLRRRIEKIFGTWKRSWGYRRTRYRSLERNRIQLALVVTAWNLLRATKLEPT